MAEAEAGSRRSAAAAAARPRYRDGLMIATPRLPAAAARQPDRPRARPAAAAARGRLVDRDRGRRDQDRRAVPAALPQALVPALERYLAALAAAARQPRSGRRLDGLVAHRQGRGSARTTPTSASPGTPRRPSAGRSTRICSATPWPPPSPSTGPSRSASSRPLLGHGAIGTAQRHYNLAGMTSAAAGVARGPRPAEPGVSHARRDLCPLLLATASARPRSRTRCEVCRRYVERQGWQLVAPSTRTGRSRARSAPGRAIRRCWPMPSAALFDVVVVEALDRLGRQLADVAALHDRLAFRGVAAACRDDGRGRRPCMSACWAPWPSSTSRTWRDKTRRGQLGRVLQGRIAGGRGLRL